MDNVLLITGATGFIGMNLAKYLVDNNKYELIGVGRKAPSSDENKYYDAYYMVDLNNYDKTQQVIDEIKPSVVVHLAGHPLAKVTKEDPSLQLKNIILTQNILYSTMEYCDKFILGSSVVVYGNSKIKLDEQSSTHPETEYAISKLVSEDLVKMYCNRNNKKYSILRFGATVGKNMTHGLIPDLIKKATTQDALNLLGNTKKPYTHISDVVKAIYLAIDTNKINGTYNICVDDNISVKDIAKIILKHYNLTKSINFSGTWAGDQLDLLVSNESARMSGWNPKYNSQQAIYQCL